METKAEYVSYCRFCLEVLPDSEGLRISETIESWFFELTQLHLKANAEASQYIQPNIIFYNGYLI